MMCNTVINDKEFQSSLSLMQGDDPRNIISGLQTIGFELEAGKCLLSSSLGVLNERMKYLIMNNTDAVVRQWCYMVGTFLRDDKLVSLCRSRFEYETPLNQSWIYALLSSCLPENEFIRFRKKYAENYLPVEIRNLSTYLFSSNQEEKVDSKYIFKILSKRETSPMLWVGWSAIFWHQDFRKNGHMLIGSNQMSEITESDNPQVLKHIMAAYSRKPDVDIRELKIDVFDYKNMDSAYKKWVLSLIWKDKTFVKENKDYFKVLMSYDHLFNECDKRVREGLAEGLSTYDFDEDFEPCVCHWIEREEEVSVRKHLITYALRWAHLCADYEEIVNDELKKKKYEAITMLIESYFSKQKKIWTRKTMVSLNSANLSGYENPSNNGNTMTFVAGDLYNALQTGVMGRESGSDSRYMMEYHEKQKNSGRS